MFAAEEYRTYVESGDKASVISCWYIQHMRNSKKF